MGVSEQLLLLLRPFLGANLVGISGLSVAGVHYTNELIYLVEWPRLSWSNSRRKEGAMRVKCPWVHRN